MPWEFAGLDRYKKAALIAMIDIRIEAERRARSKSKK